jgi:hypothetical protein
VPPHNLAAKFVGERFYTEQTASLQSGMLELITFFYLWTKNLPIWYANTSIVKAQIDHQPCLPISPSARRSRTNAEQRNQSP